MSTTNNALTVTFKTKPVRYQDLGDLQYYDYIKIPKITRNHCNMAAFRTSKRFGGYANSDLFPAMINGAVKKIIPKGKFRTDQTPEGVTIEPGYLSTVTITLEDK